MIRLPALCLAFGLGVLSAGCDGDDANPSDSAPGAVESATPAVPSAARSVFEHHPEAVADEGRVDRGRRMVGKYECTRCHEVDRVAPATVAFDCAGCHRKVQAGTLENTEPGQLAQWRENVHSLLDVPTLTATTRFRRAWLTEFLQDTHELRPGLPASMPRFSMPEADAEAIAAFLVPEAEAAVPALGDPDRGRLVLETGGCMSCHRMTGVPPVAALPPPVPVDGPTLARGQRLAPDLRFVRDRLRPAALVAWLEDPAKVKADAAMPKIPLTEREIADVAAYLLTAELADPPVGSVPERLPVLDRPVAYAEVHDRVFGKICRHCHSDPSVVAGGGPGYAGGFGFRGRKLDLSTYEGIMNGSLADDGQRRSVLEPLSDGTPRLVAHLWARHAEDAGQPRDDVRGMPLGLPPIPLEDIQLVETWIAQGGRRG